MIKKYDKKYILSVLLERYKMRMSYLILSGKKRPNYENMYFFAKERGLPFEIWLDIKNFIKQTKENKAA